MGPGQMTRTQLLADGATLLIQPYAEQYAGPVRELFIAVNRLMAPSALRERFESYVARSLREEIERIPAYYSERGGSFWIATLSGELVGMFGLEAVAPRTLELRRMYVAPTAQRRGIAATLLKFAEQQSRLAGAEWLVLSTSELQQAALALYRNNGYELEQEELAEAASNKTIGGGIRRYHFRKRLFGNRTARWGAP
mgnify:FL=1